MKIETRIGIWCLSAWCVAVLLVVSVAVTHGNSISILLERPVGGRNNLWQSLIFAISMSAVGFWMALKTRPRRIPEDPAQISYNLLLYAKGGGWIFAVGGILVALRIISLLQSE